MCVRTERCWAMLAALAATLACGGPAGPESAASADARIKTYSVGGTLSGLTSTLAVSDALVLQDDGGDDLDLTANGSFSFATRLMNGSPYAVTVARQATGYTCAVSGGADGSGGGTISRANVTSVAVSCSPTPLPPPPPAHYAVGGTVSGLSGTVVLLDEGADALSVSSNGAFTFGTSLADGSAYKVTVSTQPSGQSCTVSGGADGSGGGTVTGANVTSVTVTCLATSSTGLFTVGGTISGLSGGTVVLQNNGGDDLTLSTDGGFRFNTSLADGSAYSVTVAVQPPPTNGYLYCWVTGNGTGTIGGADVNNVTLLCSTLYGQAGWGCQVGDGGVLTGWCVGDDGACGGGMSPQCVGMATMPMQYGYCQSFDSTWCGY